MYLDTSALVKRYVEEDGSDRIDSLFEGAYREDVVLFTSQWNIAEAAVVFDKYGRKGGIDAQKTLKLFFSELELMVRMGFFKIVPVTGLIAESIPVILSHHIYVADAIQIVSCRKEGCDLFVTFDRKLSKVAKSEGLKVEPDLEL